MYHYFTTSCPRILLLHIVGIVRLAEMTETELNSLKLILKSTSFLASSDVTIGEFSGSSYLL